MPTDIENTYADEMTLAETTNGASNITLISDTIDHGGPGGRGPGPSRGIFLVISVGETFEGPSTEAVFLLQQSDDSAFSSPETLGTFTASIPLAKAGELIVQESLATVTKRFTRVTGSWSTAATAGFISAFLTTDPQATFPGRAA